MVDDCSTDGTREALLTISSPDLTILEERFGFEPVITAKLARLRCRVYEVGISYVGRTYEEGKKIGWRDGIRAIWCILKYNLRHGDRAPAHRPAPEIQRDVDVRGLPS